MAGGGFFRVPAAEWIEVRNRPEGRLRTAAAPVRSLAFAYRQEAGFVLWTVRVWRLTVIEPSYIPDELRIPAKQI